MASSIQKSEMSTPKDPSQTVNIITMGCSKNTVDSERLLLQFEKAGYRIVHNGEASEARTVIINTCGFIHDAKQESIDIILRCVNAKQKGLIDKLFVIGCLSERYKEDLRGEIPEVDQFFGARNLAEILDYLKIEKTESCWNYRHLTTPKHYAYLKIAEGCNRTCAFCSIPLIRGPYVSRPIEEIEDEARFLASQGVKELLIIAQDLTCYGIDRYKEQKLPELIHRLCQIDGIQWIRLHYTYPVRFPMGILDLMREEPKLCKYIDIPVQHISTSVLHKMRRHITQEQTEALLNTIRKKVPGIAIRTTLLVGHPGETKADFDQLLQFVKSFRFDRLGVFTYSHEEGTYADHYYDDTIPAKTKKERKDKIMEAQSAISLALNEAKIGKTFRVIIDREEGEFYIGRTAYDSPEVDGEVLIDKQKPLTIGEFYDVKITDASEYDLNGTCL